jgi:hypothetical protein
MRLVFTSLLFVCNSLLMVTVVNKKSHTPTANDIYIGRGSALGNMFTHIPSGTKAMFVVKTRELAIESYQRWLSEKIKNRDEDVLSSLRHILTRHKAGEDLNLVCYCKPLSCHGDILKEIIEKNETLITGS